MAHSSSFGGRITYRSAATERSGGELEQEACNGRKHGSAALGGLHRLGGARIGVRSEQPRTLRHPALRGSGLVQGQSLVLSITSRALTRRGPCGDLFV